MSAYDTIEPPKIKLTPAQYDTIIGQHRRAAAEEMRERAARLTEASWQYATAASVAAAILALPIEE